VINEFVDRVLGGDSPQLPLTLLQVAARGVVIYLIGLALVRVGKNRMIGRVTSLDVMLGFILGSLLSRGVTGSASITATTVAAAAMVAVHWLITKWSCRSHGFGTLVKGHVVQVVDEGIMLRKSMASSNVSEHDLMEQLRLNGVEDIRCVAKAFKERSGEISVIKQSQ
jgi:uncharacterized membrane protein YcaP (DUF421 family)